MHFRHLLLVGALTAAFPAIAAAPHYGTWGVETRDMDPSVKPGDSFFQYVEGRWLNTAQIASDKSRAGYNFDLPDATEVEVRQLVEAAGAAPTSKEMQQ